MEDCELFNVCSTEIRAVVISILSIISVYLAIAAYVRKFSILFIFEKSVSQHVS